MTKVQNDIFLNHRDRISSQIQSPSNWPFAFFSILMIVVISLADYLTGPTYSLLIFYLVPILHASWFIGKIAGIVISLLCSVAWAVSQGLASYPIDFYQIIWNSVIRLGIFILVAYLISWQWTLKKSLEKERILASMDPLTGALNKRGFLQILSQENKRSLRYQHHFSIAFVDLDNFKNVNDRHGHVVGDKLLLTFVKVVRSCLRSIDTIGRFGGDEFLILLPETGSEAALEVVQRLRLKAQKMFTRQGFELTISIGLATYLHPHLKNWQYIQEVDELMYLAKKQGKNQIKHIIFDDPD